MKKIITALLMTLSLSCFSQSSIEGKWIPYSPTFGLNTMYILENGLRYTYYCTSGNCDSIFNTYQAGDGNHLPEVNNYNFINDTIYIDLNFGNVFQSKVTFLCDSNLVTFNNGSSWVRLNANLDDCFTSIDEASSEQELDFSVYPNPVDNQIEIKLSGNVYGKYWTISNSLGQSILSGFYDESINTQQLQTGVYFLSLANKTIKFIKN